MNFSTLADDLNATADICDDIITTNQKDQLDALKKTIQTLKNIIEQKDKLISTLKGNIDIIEQNTNNFMSELLENSKDEERNELLNNLLEEPDYNVKYSSLYQLLNIDYACSKKDKDVISRLRSQLFGHALLLVRISTHSEYRNLLLMDDYQENEEITAQTKDILFEMAQRTESLVSKVSDEEVEALPYGSIANVLGCEINLEERAEVMKELLATDTLDPNELKDMLLQETVITSILTNYSNKIIETMEELEEAKKDQLIGFKNRDTEVKDILEPVYLKLCKAFGQNNMEFSFDSFIDKSEQLADNLILARERTGIDNGLFTDYVDLTDRAIYKLSKKLKETQTILKRQTSNLSKCGNEGVWQKWARSLYAGLMGFENNPANDIDLRVAIEEACLTSVGNRKLAERLQSLRTQKQIIKNLPEISKRPMSFKTLLCTTMFAKRISKISGHSKAY
ncbi:hypothetical protein TVAG_459450 [Trichomonas vaginalis G3]|uniref:Uncharacterized protein n=1 Tax=Trichomonas vaginalis (strain ATCC PRA-98 / G3) TaxID=412133 RepID=A2FHK5_TRIV3|nr:hypothetical protein TVAGG3_0741600 [Trichomonas vaginalis G3]EAX95596.1 hypothetical protein TVAG_459450 [Trichomonas vaginalis G3]KAI5511918.1 hypothetical protein TVAGG3_0741600 [Trichomonas vaginalis G3]|eukprot:XP_001308526.1 hypothetical protein [Trichomonas vaginalis G3]